MADLYYKNVLSVTFPEGTTQRVIEGKYLKHTQKGVTQLAGTSWLCYVKVEPFGDDPERSQLEIDNEKTYIESLAGQDVGLITKSEFDNA